MEPIANDTILEVRNICKSFPGVRALNGIDLSIRKGEVHAICGENGAGKSTLIKILTGVYTRDSGEYYINGQPVAFSDNHQAISAGIACIYQELTIVPLLDVANNLFLGNLPLTKFNTVDAKKMYAEANKILDQIGLQVPAKRLAVDLSLAQQQMVEIGRALTRSAKVIIMDEPTSSLSEKETQSLFQLVEKLRQEDVSIIYISHKIEEVLQISDRITVIRDGENIKTVNAKETNKDELISFMIGRTLDNLYNKEKVPAGDVIFRAQGLCKKGVFSDISFEARAGEVVGFFGLVGAGRSEIMRAIFGVDKLDSGELFIEGKHVKIKSPQQAVKLGLALIPENRRLEGLALKLNVLFNITVVKLKQISSLNIINKRKQVAIADQFVKQTQVKTPTLAQTVENLSGGNQQKIVLSKWLMMNPKILILDEPTRGIDVAAKAEIYGIICSLAASGVSVIVVSSEIPEILGICDRVIVVHEGKLSGDIPIENADSHKILACAIGVETNG